MTDYPRYDLEKFKDNSEIVHLTAKQINKDFSMFGKDVTFSGNVAFAYNELMTQLTGHIQQLLQTDQEMLFALIYQIDISQESVYECLQSHDNPARSLADLIIRREMMKVLTVQYFKNLKNKS
jgi:NADH/NAD ratio-sensing transcriptional regulator Rex